MNEELKGELGLGHHHATRLVSHLLSMSADAATFPVEMDSGAFIVEVKTKEAHNRLTQEHKDLANRSWDTQDYENIKRQLTLSEQSNHELREAFESLDNLSQHTINCPNCIAALWNQVKGKPTNLCDDHLKLVIRATNKKFAAFSNSTPSTNFPVPKPPTTQ